MKVDNYDAVWNVLKEKKERLIMENKVKEWIEMDYNNTKNYISSHPNDSEGTERIEQSVDRCYGVIMFAINNLFNEYNYNLESWWEDKMLPKFRKMREDFIFLS